MVTRFDEAGGPRRHPEGLRLAVPQFAGQEVSRHTVEARIAVARSNRLRESGRHLVEARKWAWRQTKGSC